MQETDKTYKPELQQYEISMQTENCMLIYIAPYRK